MSGIKRELIEYKKGASNLLVDHLYTLEQAFKKTQLILDKVEKVGLKDVHNITTDINKLFERMEINITAFKKGHADVTDKFKKATENNNFKKKKANLSLKRIHDSSTDEELDIECTEPSTSRKAQKSPSVPREEKAENNHVEDADLSEDESQNYMPPLRNFDAPSTSNAPDDLDSMNDEAPEDISKNKFLESCQQQEKRTESESEAQSFDFDDDDQSTKSLAKIVDEDAINESRKNNHELLELLTTATEKPNYPTYATTDQEGEIALRMIKEEMSGSSESDSDDSDLYWLVSSDGEDSDEDWTPSSDDKEEEEVEEVEEVEKVSEEVECKDVRIYLIRVDQLSDEAFTELCQLHGIDQEKVSLELSYKKKLDPFSDQVIDRLCNLDNLDKRKSEEEIKPSNRFRPKRMRLLSTSSSSSSSSTGSTTPDLNLDEINKIDLPHVSPNNEALNDLADEAIDRLADSDSSEVEISSLSDMETDEEEGKKKTPEKKKTVKKKTDDEEEVSKKNKKKYNGFDPLLNEKLWSDSSESEKEESPKKSLDEDTTIISDSTSDTDSDIEIVRDDFELGEHKGRRNIRPIISEDDLNILTQKAKTEEDERIQRLEEHSKTLEVILSQQEESFILDFDVKTNEPLIVVDAGLANKLKPHQKEGVKFMWEACYESVEMLKKSNSGTGCILGHSMGLGKTLQVVTLIHTLFVHKVTNTKHVLIVCPLSTVSNWQNEFKMAFDLLENRPNIRLDFLIQQEAPEKCFIVNEWRQKGGVLVMGYEAFQRLSSGKLKCNTEEKRKLEEALLNPGPDLIVCDEGHLLKNVEAQRSQSLMKIKTKRRIVMTGTPLQNNLTEYFYMVDFVKRHLLGTYNEYTNRFANPIMNGQYDDSRPEDIKLMKKRTHVLTKLLKKTIHRVDTNVLQGYLPEIVDYAIFVQLEPVQIELYKKYIELAKAYNGPTTKCTGFFQDFRMTKFITLHPYTIQLYYTGIKSKRRKKKKSKDIFPIEGDDETFIPQISEGWYDEFFPLDVASNIEYSAKLRVIMSIINETVKNGEKILVFAHLLSELDLVEHFLKTYGTSDFPSWRLNEDFYRMDGEVSPTIRSQLCKNFNIDPDVKVFLISHGVGGLGLNLTGASRVILIGSNHNPSIDTQSIYRVYRFGQMRKCHVYRVLSIGAMEEKIYHRCVAKLAVAGTVVDKYHYDRHYKVKDLKEMYEYNFKLEDNRPIPTVPSDKLLAKLLQNNCDIYKYHEHSALLENRPEEELNDEEKKLAWDEFKREEEVEEAARNTTAPNQLVNPLGAPSRHILPPQVARPPLYNKPQPNRPMNKVYYPLGANNLAPNPLNTGARGLLQRASFQKQSNAPQTSGLSRFSGSNVPQTSGLSRPASSNMYNRPQYSGYIRNVTRPAPSRTYAMLGGQNKRNHNSNSADRSIRVNPISQMRNQPLEIVDLVNDVPVLGEFNYALNKVV